MQDSLLLKDIFKAYYDARKYTRNKSSQLSFEVALEDNLVELYEDLKSRDYCPSPASCFIVKRPVCREVFSSEFRDRVVHHLLFNYIAPIFERYMIYDSYSCRKGMGTSEGIRRCAHHIRSCTQNYTRRAYVLKLDLRGYFMSIDKDILYGIILSIMDRNNNWEGLDKDLVIFLLQKIIYRNVVDGCHKRGDEKDFEMVPIQKSLFSSKPGTGLPIGDLTSQLFSNIYLNELDQFVKRDLKCRHYGRYVDDFYLVHEDKYYLLDCVEKIRLFLKERLHLTLHPNKITLQECTMGLNFLGAYICPFRNYASNRTVGYYRLACKCIDRRCRFNANIIYHDSIMKMCSVLNSYLGHLKQFRTGRIRQEGMKNNSIKWFCYTNGRVTKIKPSIYGYYVNNPDYCGVGRQIGDLSPICSPERCKRRTLDDSQVRNPAGDSQSGSFAWM